MGHRKTPDDLYAYDALITSGFVDTDATTNGATAVLYKNTAAGVAVFSSYSPNLHINLRGGKVKSSIEDVATGLEPVEPYGHSDGGVEETAANNISSGNYGIAQGLNAYGFEAADGVQGCNAQWALQNIGVSTPTLNPSYPATESNPYLTPTDNVAGYDGAGAVIAVIERLGGTPTKYTGGDPNSPVIHPESHFWNSGDPTNPAAAEENPGEGGVVMRTLGSQTHTYNTGGATHGTGVTSIISAKWAASGALKGKMRGIAPAAKILCYRFQDAPGSYVQCIPDAADLGARVVNNSWSSYSSAPRNQSPPAEVLKDYYIHSALFSRLSQYAAAQDCLLVSAAGNRGINLDTQQVPSGFKTSFSEPWPKSDLLAINGVAGNGVFYDTRRLFDPPHLVVAGSAPRDYDHNLRQTTPTSINLTAYARDPGNKGRQYNLDRPMIHRTNRGLGALTDFGGRIDLAAPSGAADNTVVAGLSNLQNYVYTADPWDVGDRADLKTQLGLDIGYHTYVMGTSCAVPHVVGAAALVIQAYRDSHAGANPSLAQLRSFLLNGAKDEVGPPTEDHVEYSWQPDPDTASSVEIFKLWEYSALAMDLPGEDNYFGKGGLDIPAAIALAEAA